MTFRYDEAADETRNRAMQYRLAQRENIKHQDRLDAADLIDDLIESHGPVIDFYPDWHPLNLIEPNRDELRPYHDHALHFRDAVLLAPYNDPPLEPLQAFCESHRLLANEIKGLYHNKNCKLFVIESLEFACDTDSGEKYIDQRKAVGALLDCWKCPEGYGRRPYDLSSFECWESWEDMHKHLLGAPCGKRSSLFVDEKTGQAIRRLYAVIGQSLGLKEYGRV